MNRRSFLGWGVAGFAALVSSVAVSFGAVLRFLVPDVFYEPPMTFKIGKPADFAYGPPSFMSDEKIFVFHEREAGFHVVSAVCTHLGCTVQYFKSDDRFHCPCHGSIYQANGTVVHGPAPKPLPWFEITLATDGQLVVDKDKVVSDTYHLMV